MREENSQEHNAGNGEQSYAYYEFVPDDAVLQTSIKAIEFFESKYKCSGFCNPGLFYYSLDLDQGMPKTSCLMYLKQEVNNSLTVLGVVSLICGLLMMLAWCAQYALWCNYSDDMSGKSVVEKGLASIRRNQRD